MVLENLVDPILRPLLVLPDAVFLLIVALFFGIIINIAYKFLTNQNLMKDLRTELKEFQKEIKELRDNPKKAMEVQQKSMSTNMKYMQHSMRPMLFTMLPIMIIFGWLNAHMAYNPLYPGNDFSVQLNLANGVTGDVMLLATPNDSISISGPAVKNLTGQKHVSWTLHPESEGTYQLSFDFSGSIMNKSVIVSSEKGNYSSVEDAPKNPSVKKLILSNEKKKVSIFGLFEMGWIWVYIIFLTIFNMGIKKALKIY